MRQKAAKDLRTYACLPKQNLLMSEQLLNEDATISGENKSSAVSETPGSSGKRKRKQNRNRSGQKNIVKFHEIGEETSINNNCQEQSSELVNAADVIVSSKICSQIKQSEAVSPPKPGKKKRVKKKKGKGSINGNGTGLENVKATSSNGSPLEGDVLYHPSACINMDGKLLKQGAEPSLSEDTSMAQPESQRHDTKESSSNAAVNNDNCHGLQMGGALPILDVKAINSTCTLERSSLPEVPEQFDAVVSPTPRNKKRARKKKGKNPLNDNGTGFYKLEATSSNGPPLEGDVFAHPSACIQVDDKIKHGAELCLSEDTSMPQQENQRHDTKESSADVAVNNDNCHGLQMGGAVPVLDVKAINSTCKLESSSLPEVPEQSDAVVTPTPINKKRARKKKGKYSLNDNSAGSDKLEATSSNGSPLEGDVFAPSACIKVDDKIKQVAELCLSVDTSMPQQENQRHGTKESSTDVAINSGNCQSLKMGGALPVLDVKAINSTCKLESSSLPEVPEQSDAVVTPTLRNKKRARKKKGKNSLNDNVTGCDKLEATSSDGSPLDGDVFAHPSACIKVDDQIKHGAELCLSVETSRPQQENQRHDTKESSNDVEVNNGNCHGLQVGGALPVMDVKAINSTCKLESSSLPEVPEQRSFPPNSVNVSPMIEPPNHADAYSVMDEDHNEEENVKTYLRKRRKISCSSGKSSETITEGASSVVLIFPDESGNNCLNYPGEALSTVCSGYTLEQEALAGNGTSMAAGKDICSDLKHPSMAITENSIEPANGECSVKDVTMAELTGENCELAEMAKLNSTVNAVCDMHSAEEKMDSEGKAPVVGSARGPFQTFEQKIQTKTEESISSSSELGSLQVNATQPINQPSLGTAHNGSSKKKLLVLDVNGLLADIVPFDNVQYEPDTIISTKAVFKRPFCDDFLKFCFERFNVGVWSSRTKRNVQRFLDFLFRKKGYNIYFCWDQAHCTETGFKTIENREKPLLLKELKKLWEKQDPDLPWESGEYDESNTLLLDDSPYKALRNPPNTAIFPYTFEYWHKTDNALAAKGHLRMYLERLAAAENVQKFVEQNPFGQRPITKTSISWPFYLKVIGSTASPPEAGGNSSSATKSPLEEETNASLAC